MRCAHCVQASPWTCSTIPIVLPKRVVALSIPTLSCSLQLAACRNLQPTCICNSAMYPTLRLQHNTSGQCTRAPLGILARKSSSIPSDLFPSNGLLQFCTAENSPESHLSTLAQPRFQRYVEWNVWCRSRACEGGWLARAEA